MPKKLRERSNATLADVTQPGRMVTLSSPGADMMFRMASAISRNPDKEFEVKPPPLEVSYEE